MMLTSDDIPTTKKEDDEEEERGRFLDVSATTTTCSTTGSSVIIIPRSKSLAAARRVTPTCAITSPTVTAASVVEKHLPNGDLYVGDFSGNAPHGSGKYLWTDGCMYEGDWKRGKASGKGKFSWPSGATFQGEFKAGRMEGTGTFIGSDGDMYKGSWSADRKHGKGQKHYSNGDYYEGQWKRNFQDGQGRYVWKNGNEYTGEWKNGMIHGKGVLIWANGNKYDGNWENGVPKGHGVFTWPDGSSYIGCWSKDNKTEHPKNQVLNGTFYPAQNSRQKSYDMDNHDFNFTNEGFEGLFGHKLAAPLMADENSGVVMMGMGKKRTSIDGDRVTSTEKIFPRICIWESDGDAGDITCDIIDTAESSIIYQDGSPMDKYGTRPFRSNPWCFNGDVKKPGQTISKGHKNYELMLNLQLGIR